MEDYKRKYLKYKNKYLLNKSIVMTGGESKQNELLLFKAEWCGHCKNFLPTWEKISNDTSLNINFKTFDSDKNKKEIKDFDIQGFPTIMYKVDDKLIEYNGSRDEKSIKEFIISYQNK
jgi:thioredoxin-like negative regulator of GroEL